MKKKLSFAIRKEDEGGFSAQCIEFPGIITEAETELRKMIDEAITGYFEAFPEEKSRLKKIKKGKIIEVAF